jgi:hypothetical protein
MRWLRGNGIEVGAGANPVRLFGDASAQMSDCDGTASYMLEHAGGAHPGNRRRMKRFSLVLAGFSVAGAAIGQNKIPVATTPLADTTLVQVGANVQTPSGSLSVVVFDAAAYGAKCDGVTDDSAAFNAALSAIRSVKYPGSWRANWANGNTAKIVMSHSAAGCLIEETLNATLIRGGGVVWDGNGAVFVCETNGTPCIDASGTENVQFSGLNIYGSATRTPNIGLALGRVSIANPAADHDNLEHVTIGGYFTLSAFYSNQSETSYVNSSVFTNSYAAKGTGTTGTYAAIFDGANHFAFQTVATGGPFPTDSPISFNEATCNECVISAWGLGDVPLWIGSGTARHKFINSYVFNWTSAGTPAEPAIVLYAPYSYPNENFLDLDIHFENVTRNRSMSSIILFAGYANITIEGLHLRDQGPQQSGPLFARDAAGTYGAAVSTVTINNANFEIGILSGTMPSWFDTPDDYTINGYVFDQDSTWTPPGAFSGRLCLASKACSDTVGQLRAGGTTFTLGTGTGGCATTSALTGGAVVGSFNCTSTAGPSTQIINLPKSTNGYVCTGGDATSGVAWANVISSASTGKISGTLTSSGDTVAFSCISGY